jgi:hypothetical protein
MLRVSPALRKTGLGGRLGGSGGGGANPGPSGIHTADPTANMTMFDRAKLEFWKILKIQLVLVPVGVGVMLFMWPPLSEEEIKKKKAEYKKSTGWKS